MSIVEVKDLSKSFGDLEVLKDLNLSVEKGEVVTIIGSSGCGKSVFLRCLNLLEKPDSGRVIIDGEEITAKGADVDKIRQNMGMVFQKFHLFSHMNVMENLCAAPTKLLSVPRDEAESRARELLSEVGLLSKAEEMPYVLSGGQQQRVAICRSLMMNPKVILMDEPTSALDPSMVGEVLAVIRMLAKQKLTMIIVTHEMRFAKDVADTVLFFADHGIYEEGSPREIFNHPKKEKTIAFINRQKRFSYDINSQSAFDLMKMQGGIWSFAERYGITEKQTYALQRCSEELVYIFFRNSYPKSDSVDIKVEIAYSETKGNVVIDVVSGGMPHNPFAEKGQEDDEDLDYLGVMMVEKTAQDCFYACEDEKNLVRLEMRKI